jgi:hypothetical protein
MRVLELAAYDVVLGYDWLGTHSPMICHWELKTLEFMEGGQQVHLEGVKTDNKAPMAISPDQVVRWHKGNDIWTMAVVQQTQDKLPIISPPLVIQQMLSEYQDIFVEPAALPPHREYGHAIPLLLGVVPVNSRPYRYSPLHKDEIEKQVKSLL